VSLNRLWMVLAIALPVLASLLASLSSIDLAYHLRAGDEILATGSIPRADAWTFTGEGLPWLDQQWGSQVILATVFRLAGWTGLALLRAALVGVIFGCLVLIARRQAWSWRNAALLTLAAFVVAATALALRPQLLGMALFALVLLIVADRDRHPTRLWAIPILVVLWANVHGSFFLAPLILGLAWLEDRAAGGRRTGATIPVALVSAIAACLTPFGPGVWTYAIGLSTNAEVTRRVTEWQPTTIRDGTGILFFLSVAAVTVLIARAGRTIPWPTLAWLGVFVAIGLYAQRGLAWWPLAAVVPVAGLLATSARDKVSGREPSTPPMMARSNAILVAALLLAGVALLPVWRPVDPATQVPAGVLTDAPPGVAAALRDLTEPGDHVFNPQAWGSWFEFAVPEVKVALDSRIEFFPVEVWEAYEAVWTGREGWQERLEAWNVAIVVVPADDDAFRDRLVAAGWIETYHDADGTILRRPTGLVDWPG
jgi:hypothetical protein